ncbi:tetratricopeptide repeat protein [Amphritea pacifica]|uniref:Sel1 repeat family protein n=1 Tax=Amphritea pacifica TaxID=2811233 RepID=A0ABS2W4Q1_9GAMM|nr:sel1 repeat family protein [Amphritea pacifica]MBN0986688.1 sel1 repeat family protein [Amphritea pacifica]
MKDMFHSTDGIFDKAYAFYEKGMLEEAFDYFLRGAESGDTSCMIWVGVLYGDGVKEDAQNKEEISWYERAWKKGELSAANNLAIVYKNQKNYSDAECWFKKAIRGGDGDANLELAKMLIDVGRENKEIRSYLTATIESNYVTEASIDEAQTLLESIA